MTEIKTSIRLQTWFKLLSEKLGFDVEYLVRSGLWVGIGHVFGMARGFVLMLVLTHFLSQQVFGQYNWLISILSIVSVFSLSGIGVAIMQAVARGNDGAYRQGVKLSLRWGALGGLAFLGLAFFYYFLKGEGQFGMTFFLMAFLFPFYTTAFLSNSFWGGKQRFDLITKQTIIVSFLSFIVMATVAILFQNLTFQILAFLFSTIIFNGFFTQRAYKLAVGAEDINLHIYGRQQSNINILSLLSTNIEYFFIPFFVGFELFASFALALALAGQLKSAFKLLSSIILPKLSARSFDSARSLLTRYLVKITIGALICGGLVSALVPWVIHIFFPAKYVATIFYAQILFFAEATTLPFMFIYQFFTAQKMVKQLYSVTFFNLAVKIVLLLPLIYFWHLAGATIAYLLFRVFSLAYILFLFWRSTKN